MGTTASVQLAQDTPLFVESFPAHFGAWLDEFKQSRISQGSNISEAVIRAFVSKMKKQITTETQLNEMVRYFDDLNSSDARLINLAVLWVTDLENIIFLKPSSLSFLNELYNTEQLAFHKWVTTLNQIIVDQNLCINRDHIDIVITALIKQQAAPANLQATLLNYLNSHPLQTISDAVTQIKNQHLNDLHIAAINNNLMYHTQEHAFEITARTLHIMNTYNLFTDAPVDLFLKEIIGLMLLFHDYEVRKRGSYLSVEQLSATLVTQWITEAFPEIKAYPDILTLVDLLAEKIILLGTQLCRDQQNPMGQKNTLDLSCLFIKLQTITHHAGIQIAESTNQSLFATLNNVMLITGVCDKDPAALLDNVMHSCSFYIPAYVGLRLSRTSQLDKYFKSGHFTPYYTTDPVVSSTYSLDHINQQLFSIGFIAHMSMSCELTALFQKNTLQIEAKAFITSINEYRQHLRTLSLQQLATAPSFFQHNNDQNFPVSLIETIFFNSLAGEINFIESQNYYLSYVSQQLSPLGITINLQWTQTEVANLRGFKCFYDNLSPDSKRLLIEELIYIAILQPGMIFFHEFKQKNEKPIPTGARRSGSRFFSQSQLDTSMVMQSQEKPSESINGSEMTVG